MKSELTMKILSLIQKQPQILLNFEFMHFAARILRTHAERILATGIDAELISNAMKFSLRLQKKTKSQPTPNEQDNFLHVVFLNN